VTQGDRMPGRGVVRAASRARIRRRLLAALIGLILAVRAPRPVPADATPPARPSLYVYLHTEVKFSALEKALGHTLPDLEVTVFGRFRDFEESNANRKPDAVQAQQPMLAMLALPTTQQGLRGDSEWEPYVLLSEEGVAQDEAAARVVGVVDLLGRTGTQQLVSRLLRDPHIELRRVTKLEDLLPLLQFSAAGSVLASASAAKTITQRSRLRLRVQSVPDARVGLPALGVWTPEKRALIVRQVQAIDPAILHILGLDRWGAR
jgi:hypothetical protein